MDVDLRNMFLYQKAITEYENGFQLMEEAFDLNINNIEKQQASIVDDVHIYCQEWRQLQKKMKDKATELEVLIENLDTDLHSITDEVAENKVSLSEVVAAQDVMMKEIKTILIEKQMEEKEMNNKKMLQIKIEELLSTLLAKDGASLEKTFKMYTDILGFEFTRGINGCLIFTFKNMNKDKPEEKCEFRLKMSDTSFVVIKCSVADLSEEVEKFNLESNFQTFCLKVRKKLQTALM